MKFQRRVRQDIDVNMTPLIGVVFLFLIFFMVSTTCVKESRLGITLPKAEIADSSVQESETIEVFIDAKGGYKIAGVSLPDSDLLTLKQALKAKLNELVSENSKLPQPKLTITADAATPHQFVVTTMDVAGQLGFSKLSISTLKTEPQ